MFFSEVNECLQTVWEKWCSRVMLVYKMASFKDNNLIRGFGNPKLFGGSEHFLFPIYWESSSQLTFIFFRGVGIPPTRKPFEAKTRDVQNPTLVASPGCTPRPCRDDLCNADPPKLGEISSQNYQGHKQLTSGKLTIC